MPSLYPGYRSYNPDEDGPVKLTPRLLKQLCVKHKGYSTPSLNEVLYLHYLGIPRIESLEEYVNVRVLWLEGNGLTRIENIGHLTQLVCLYLQENCIETIEGLESIELLNQLNLANNFISAIPASLRANTKLESLNLANNKLASPSSVSLSGLEGHPSITSLDLSNNDLSADDDLLRILGSMPSLRVLRLEGNPVLKAMPQYRRRVISSIKSLVYLDSRPVFEDERRAVEAWERGGLEEERRERMRIEDEARAKRVREFVSMKAFMEGCDRDECVRRGKEEEARVLRELEEKRRRAEAGEIEGREGDAKGENNKYDVMDLDAPDFDEGGQSNSVSEDSNIDRNNRSKKNKNIKDNNKDLDNNNNDDDLDNTKKEITYTDGDLFDVIE